MDEAVFSQFLARQGKKASVIAGLVEQVRQFEAHLAQHGRKTLATAEARQMLAEQSGVPAAVILELVKLADLARLGGLKGIRARLYYEAGADTLEKIAAYEPEELGAMLADFVARTGFDGIAPLPKEVRNAVANAGRLPKLVHV
jgi:hypothetical protein